MSPLTFTGVHVHLLVAVTAVHRAAPVELALALGGLADPGRVVAPAAAHHLTAVHPTGRTVTETSACAHGPWTVRDRKTRRHRNHRSRLPGQYIEKCNSCW